MIHIDWVSVVSHETTVPDRLSPLPPGSWKKDWGTHVMSNKEESQSCELYMNPIYLKDVLFTPN